MRVMRGAPRFPRGLAPTSLTHGIAAILSCAVHSSERCATRPTKGTPHMNPNLRRRNGARPQLPQRPRNGTGNPRQQYERYLARAREAQQAGDEIEMENCYQHAEHYFRVMRAAST